MGKNPIDFMYDTTGKAGHVAKEEYPSLKIKIDIRSEYGILFNNTVPWTLERLWGADIWYGKIPFCKTILLINIIVWLLNYS